MTDQPATGEAFGAPGVDPRWTSSVKDGIGTAYSGSSRVWFTLGFGIINEIYFPYVDTPNTRDLQLLITDGESFCHEEKRDLEHLVERPDSNAQLYRVTNSDPGGRYRIIKEIICEPHSSVVLMSVNVEVADESLRQKLRLFVLLAPHVQNTGEHNSARYCHLAGKHLLQAERENIHLVLGCDHDFIRRSVGFVGHSDGWIDLKDNYQMDWEFSLAQNGNIAMTAEIDLSGGFEFCIGVGLGTSVQSAATQLLQAFARPFEQQRARFIEQWKRTAAHLGNQGTVVGDLNRATAALVQLSHCVLLTHEDKTFAGATVASMSIPWGDTKDDSDAGGYHLIWARDMVQNMTALMACGELESPLRALIWLSCVQHEDGGMPQNSQIDGTAYWNGLQLDEVAAPVILAWRLQRVNALKQFDPWMLVSRAARCLIQHGPVTAQERWEENSGYSPSTLAAEIAALVCAADFAMERNDAATAEFLLDYADWMVASLDSWTVTSCGELVPGKPRHFIRITPALPKPGIFDADPDSAMIEVKNGGGTHAARNVVDGGFLQLVRYGIRAADDPVIVDSVAVIDLVLKRDLPQGPCWRRYNHDGYGEYPDGRAFDGAGEGRCWPILTGERGHYEITAGRDPQPYIKAMEGFGSATGLLPEQVWDAPDLPEAELKFGAPTGSAMPLCWAHAEYILLVHSAREGIARSRLEPVYQRYVVRKTINRMEVWTFSHQPARIRTGKQLRIILEVPALVHWTSNIWADVQDISTQPSALDLHFADLPIENLPDNSEIQFTFRWPQADHWEGQNFSVKVGDARSIIKGSGRGNESL